MGDGFTSISYSGSGWNPQIDSDCVFTGSGACEQQWGFDITGAYKHYWLPILSSAVYGSYLELHYPAGALAGFGLEPQGNARRHQSRLDPARGLQSAAEFIYALLNQTRPVGLAPDVVLAATGLPAFKPATSQYSTRLRIQRALTQ
jgi:hypothetical protein